MIGIPFVKLRIIMYKHNNVTILLKCVTFIFLLIPFISHIYGAIFPALYNYKIGYISSAIILFIFLFAMYERKIVYDKNVIYFIPFLLVALADSIYSNNFYFYKYFAYVVIYFLFLQKFFLQKFIFKIYVNFLVVSLLILITIFLVTLNSDFDYFSYFNIANLSYLSPNAPINNWSEDYRGLIFYFLVFVPGDVTGIFDFPRLYGFSREPGMFVTFLVPGFWMACYLKMKRQASAATEKSYGEDWGEDWDEDPYGEEQSPGLQNYEIDTTGGKGYETLTMDHQRIKC